MNTLSEPPSNSRQSSAQGAPTRWPVRSVGFELLLLILAVAVCLFVLPVGAVFALAMLVHLSERTGIFLVMGLMAIGIWLLFPIVLRAARWAAERRGRWIVLESGAISLPVVNHSARAATNADALLRLPLHQISVEAGWTKSRQSSISGRTLVRFTSIAPWLLLKTKEVRVCLHAENDRGTSGWQQKHAQSAQAPQSDYDLLVFVRDLERMREKLLLSPGTQT